ncbi:ImmA/IrrE family metallo-endopeptidase [Streptomyces calidiresistens]|uniref:ImmA/IrrE family metallo-endopeptidase n=1 Tax=Streptomyces calidiresistens TaxID=1485586 RepID=UPI001E573B5F|nr:ImmA/IrrE family metallo-endopeptidase [Streptomyces calidiresistens]
MTGIEIPSPFDVRSLCDAVAEYRQRPLLLEAVEGVAGSENELCGLWVELDHADFIFYEASTSPLHRDHIVLHEIGHILLGHRAVGGDADLDVNLTGLFTGIDPETVRNVLGRSSFSSRQEREAEQLATRIAGQAMLKPPPARRAPELDRLDSALRYE